MFGNTLRKFSYSKHIEASRLDHVVLVRGKSTQGQDTWFYVMVDYGKLKAFKSSQGLVILNIEDYGRVLYSGMGAHPSDIARWQMEREYGFIG